MNVGGRARKSGSLSVEGEVGRPDSLGGRALDSLRAISAGYQARHMQKTFTPCLVGEVQLLQLRRAPNAIVYRISPEVSLLLIFLPLGMPRTKVTNLAKLPIRVENLGSSAAGLLNFGESKLYDRMRAEVWHLAKRIPVYLLSPEQMDAVYPPEENKTLNDPDCVARALREIEERLKDMPEEARRKERWGLLAKCKSATVTVAVYHRGGLKHPALPKEITDDPAILICAERVVDWAQEESVSLQIALAKIYYHVLGHAELDRGAIKYSEDWVRIIEQSLCSQLALSHFEGRQEQKWVMRLIDSQPLEYQGYRYFWAFDSHLGERIFDFYSGWWNRPWPRIASHIWEVASHIRQDIQQGAITLEKGIKALADWIHGHSPFGWSESLAIAQQLLRGWVHHGTYGNRAFPPEPISLAPKAEWLRFKAGDPMAPPADWWNDLAWEILNSLGS